MKLKQRFLWWSLMLVVLLLAAGLTASGCGGNEPEPTAGLEEVVLVANTPAASTTTTTSPVGFDSLSTFESKDPFVPRIVKVSATPAASGGASDTTTTSDGSTTTSVPGSSSTSTTAPPSSTTTSTPTKVTTPLHSLKVLSIGVANGVPVVTFEVDDVVYEDRREGDIESTPWGQIKVVDIDPEAQEVVFLHGSEIRVLKVGEEYLK